MKNVKYSVGEIVYVKQNPVTTGESTKLQARFKGPLVITEVLPSDTYRVQNLRSKEPSSRDVTAHVRQLKLWTGVNEESDFDDDLDELREDSVIDNKDNENLVNTEPDDKTTGENQTNTVILATDVRKNKNVEEINLRKSVRSRHFPYRFKDYELD